MCSESNAPGEITSIRIILEARLFQNFLRPSRCRFRCIIRSGPSTAEGSGRLIFAADSGNPLQVLYQAALGQ